MMEGGELEKEKTKPSDGEVITSLSAVVGQRVLFELFVNIWGILFNQLTN